MKNPRTILITGASSGIGEALAVHYSKEAVLLALTGRNLERLRNVAKQCEEHGAEVIYEVLDVKNSNAMHNFISKIEEIHPIDMLFANAGVSYSTTDTYIDKPSKDIEIVMVNLCGVIHTINPVIEKMKIRGRGQIGIMSSLAAYIPTPNYPAYGATKAAVKSFGLALRAENAPHGIGVSVICPGYVHSLMTKNLNKPFKIIDAKTAAEIIKRKIIKNQSIIAFPFSVYICVIFVACFSRLFLAKINSAINNQERDP